MLRLQADWVAIAMQHRSNTRHAGALQRIRWVSHLLDNALPIPGTQFRVGLDPLLGLVPGAGDWVSAVLSVYIVLESLRFRLPKKVLLQMLSNLLMDTVAGSVPVAGDVFDVAWKANHRNLKLLEDVLHDPRPQKPADRLFVAIVILGLLALLALVTLTVFFAASATIRFLQGS